MIINADDFGYSHSVNEGIVKCFKEGVINRTTIMVNMPYTEEAVALAKENGFFDKVGIHINLTEGPALTKECAASVLCDENGNFKGTFHIPFKARLYLPKKIRSVIYNEAKAQIEKYIGFGFTLMHLDSHNYVHSYFSVYSPISRLIKEYGFKTTRISRNVSKEALSLPFRIYKAMFNGMLKLSGIGTTKYFCSLQDFEMCQKQNLVRDDLELMTHPDIIDGILTDNTLPQPGPFITKEKIKELNLRLEDTSGKKKKLLVCFIQAHMGGAMTSLVNFLNAIDTEAYEVDVLFYKYDKTNRYGIKEEINLLPPGQPKKNVFSTLRRLIDIPYLIAKWREFYQKSLRHNKRMAVQIISKYSCKHSPKIKKHYDIAVAYEFTWSLNYVISMVDAEKKLLWFHGDFAKSGMDFKTDRRAFNKADALVFVSSQCKDSFVNDHPEYSKKAFFMPNLLSSDYVRQRGSSEAVTLPYEKKEGDITFITVARINFDEKGFDRGVLAFARLKADGLTENVKWLIIGKGRHLDKLNEMIDDHQLRDNIFTIGAKDNPMPYLAECDAFLLPSRHEGKPMAITEAFIMGVVPVVTEYTSAREQISDGVDGFVFDNNDQALYNGLKKILTNPGLIAEMKDYILSHDYGNTHEISVFYSILKELDKK